MHFVTAICFTDGNNKLRLFLWPVNCFYGNDAVKASQVGSETKL